ncbi:LysR substrate-binding domain-containing protein [Variovorax sp. PvP013]|uniref:LysR family transcriptional regulator n=1 Tax=Variovorax sp. PvP013 TaxID=3156435 RepID=UPI003D203595
MAGVMAFLAVAEHSSFTAAGLALGVARATIGAQILGLEKRLGVRLFQRSTRAVTLTEAGRAYRAALAGFTEQVCAAERVARSFQTEAIGRLRIAAPPDLGVHHLAPVVTAYLDTHPGMAIALSLSTASVDLVGGGYDLAIRGALTLEPNLVTRRIGTSPIVACAAPAYLARHGIPETPQALTAHACLHFSELRWGHAWHFCQGKETVEVPIQPKLECNDGPTLLAAALGGAGIALEPAFVVGPALREGTLVPVLTAWQLPVIPLHAVYPAHRHIAYKVRSFVDMLADVFSKHPDFSG